MVLVAAMLVFLGIRIINRERAEVEPIPAEAERKAEIRIDSTGREKYRKAALYWEARYKADSALKTAARSKDKQAAEKAHQSANTYAKMPTLPNCDKALADCQEENETKAYSIAVQERMLAEADSLDRVRVAEIDRQKAQIDTCFAKWGKANEEIARLEKKVKRKNKLLKVGAGIIAALAVLVAVK